MCVCICASAWTCSSSDDNKENSLEKDDKARSNKTFKLLFFSLSLFIRIARIQKEQIMFDDIATFIHTNP